MEPAAVVPLALVPPLTYALALRFWRSRQGGPPVPSGWALAWGATGAILLGGLLTVFLAFGLGVEADLLDPALMSENAMLTGGLILTFVVLAPMAEEVAKPVGLRLLGRRWSATRDAMLLGAIMGIGFAMTENLVMQGLTFSLLGPGDAYLLAVAWRGTALVALHAATASLTALGFARYRSGERPRSYLLRLYGLAVLLHALANATGLLGLALPDDILVSTAAQGVVVLAAVTTALVLFWRAPAGSPAAPSSPRGGGVCFTCGAPSAAEFPFCVRCGARPE